MFLHHLCTALQAEALTAQKQCEGFKVWMFEHGCREIQRIYNHFISLLLKKHSLLKLIGLQGLYIYIYICNREQQFVQKSLINNYNAVLVTSDCSSVCPCKI